MKKEVYMASPNSGLAHALQVVAVQALIIIAAGLTGASGHAHPTTPAREQPSVLHGAGSMYPDILFRETLKLFAKIDPDAVVKYDPIGSGMGVRALKDGVVDFAVTTAPVETILVEGIDPDDEPDPDAEVEQLLEVPVAAGMWGLLYNIKGVGYLNLSQRALAGIFDGSITNWRHHEITKHNQTLKLPNLKITVVGRRDESGANYALSGFLMSTEKTWATIEPSLKPPEVFPKDAVLVSSSAEIVSKLAQINGAIGYTPSAFGATLGIPMAHLENKAGNFVAPSLRSGIASVEAIADKPHPLLLKKIMDPGATDAYPIISLYWLVTDPVYASPERARQVKAFAEFVLSGQVRSAALSSGYIPIPMNMRKASQALVKTIQ